MLPVHAGRHSYWSNSKIKATSTKQKCLLPIHTEDPCYHYNKNSQLMVHTENYCILKKALPCLHTRNHNIQTCARLSSSNLKALAITTGASAVIITSIASSGALCTIHKHQKYGHRCMLMSQLIGEVKRSDKNRQLWTREKENDKQYLCKQDKMEKKNGTRE